MTNFWCSLRDIIIAILRLIMLELVLLVTGLHHILFNHTEISNITLVMVPQRRDRERLAFVDDLRNNNFDLVNNVSPPTSGYSKFKEDDEFDDIDDADFDDSDIDDTFDDENDENDGKGGDNK